MKEQLLYFVSSGRQTFEALIECHAKNILISYFYLPKVAELDEVTEYFARVFVDSGAFSAFSLGKTISMDEYYDFLKASKGQMTTAVHFDVVDNITKTVANMKHALDKGLDWVTPVLQWHWGKCLAQMEQLNSFDYYCLGGAKYRQYGYTLEDAVRKLPRTKRWHGFAKVNFDLYKKKMIYSADSSSWVSAGRYGISLGAERGNWISTVTTGRKGADKLEVIRLYNKFRDDCDACGISLQGVLEGDYHHTTKLIIACFYRPRLRELGMFKDNFWS